MFLTRGQQAGDQPPAKTAWLLVTLGSDIPAITNCGASGKCVTPAGDPVTTSSKSAMARHLSSPLGSATAGTSSILAIHSMVSVYPATKIISYDASTSPIGQHTLESASANPVHTCGQSPYAPGPGRFSRGIASATLSTPLRPIVLPIALQVYPLL